MSESVRLWEGGCAEWYGEKMRLLVLEGVCKLGKEKVGVRRVRWWDCEKVGVQSEMVRRWVWDVQSAEWECGGGEVGEVQQARDQMGFRAILLLLNTLTTN